MKTKILLGVATTALIMSGGAAMSTPTAHALPAICSDPNKGRALTEDCARLNQQAPDGNYGTGDPAHNICVITGHNC
jgi:hypothetical protein